ncbi:MAG TPA: sigma-54 dependent transcriptional regulator [Planctomycetota bacterium]|nr:sigma-54 dependent transcriptional regulator [Planctomycetota bacterium]
MSEPSEFRFGKPVPRILVVDDEKMIRWSLRSCFEEAGAYVEEAANLDEARRALQQTWPSLIVLDLKLPDGSGLDLLVEIREQDSEVPILMITAFGSLRGAVEAMRVGAFDYVSKPFDLDDLLLTAQRALEHTELRRIADLHARGESSEWSVSESPATLETINLLKRIGLSGASTVLLTGESGVGKGFAARFLHTSSSGENHPFIPVACTSIPETLLESELFGHEKGAFPDAKESKRGLAELAKGGTLFLDEVGDLSLGIQAKLLTLLEDRTFRRVGGTRQLQLEARVVAATNRNLEKAVEEGQFRSDLYYRLKAFPVEVPSLRNRKEDIPALANYFLKSFREEFAGGPTGFSPEAEELMSRFSWPGNVRELRNSVERASLLSQGELVMPADLPIEVANAEGESVEEGAMPTLPIEGLCFEDLEKKWVQEALQRSKGNRTEAARLLGMNRDQIRYRINKFKLG